MADVELGIEAESFLEGKVGKYLIHRAENELQAALDALKTVCPEDTTAIREYQNQAWRAEAVQTWLAEVIQTGWNSEEMLQQQDQG